LATRECSSLAGVEEKIEALGAVEEGSILISFLLDFNKII